MGKRRTLQTYHYKNEFALAWDPLHEARKDLETWSSKKLYL